jgi:hypothetical protein
VEELTASVFRVENRSSRVLRNIGGIYLPICSGPGSVAYAATDYKLDGPGIESRWGGGGGGGGGRDFPHLSRPVLGPTQPPVQWIQGLSRGLRLAGA